MKRSITRENAFIAIFQMSFGATPEELASADSVQSESYTLDEYGQRIVRSYTNNCDVIDAMIEQRLKGWEVDRVSRVNMAILRLAVAEMNYVDPDIDSVVINEAVELAKKYGSDTDYQFINGVLGAIARAAQGGTFEMPATPE